MIHFAPYFCGALLFLSATLCSASNSQISIADFSTTASYQLRHDVNVSSASAEKIDPTTSESAGLKFTANLEGPGASWAGLRVPTPGGLPAGTDSFELNLRGDGRTGGVWITLNEQGGTSWTTNVRTGAVWSRQSLPIYAFSPAAETEYAAAKLPMLRNVNSVDVYVDATFQGLNGFSINELVAADYVPQVELNIGAADLTQQNSATLTVEARDPTSGKTAPYDGTIGLGVEDTSSAILPKTVLLQNGRATFEVFPRRAEPLYIFLYEPFAGRETSGTFQVKSAPLAVTFSVKEFEGEQVMVTNEIVAPSLSLKGNHLPLSAHLTLKDHKQDTIVASYFSVSDLHAGKGKLMVPRPGLYEAHVRLVAEPTSVLPYLRDNLPVRSDDVSTTTPEQLPEGITTRTVLAHQVYLQELPTTATVLGEDRFPFLVQLTPPREMFFNRWQFGMSIGDLFRLPTQDISAVGRKRLRWQRKLGSSWTRGRVPWPLVQPLPNGFQWQTANDVMQQYGEASMKVLAVLTENPAWSPQESPVTEEALSSWKKLLREMNSKYSGRFWGWEVWDKPNTTEWSPAPDPLAYRELVKTTWDALRTSGTEVIQGPRVVAGATSGFDPVFLDHLCGDGYGRFFDALSIQPTPQAPTQSPEANSLPGILDETWSLYHKHGLGRPVAPGEPTQIWLTEFGYGSAPEGVSEKLQANYLVRSYAIALHKGVLKLFWPALMDEEVLPWRGGVQGHTGLLNANGRPKLAAVAYNLASFMMTSMNPAGPVQQQGKATIYSFNIEAQSVKWPGVLHIAWIPEHGDEQDVELPMTRDQVYAFDYLGADRPGTLLGTETSDTSGTAELRAEDAVTTRTYRFRVDDEPLYIWDAGAPPTRKGGE